MTDKVAHDNTASSSGLTSKNPRTPYSAAENQARSYKTQTRRSAATPKRAKKSKVPSHATARQPGPDPKTPGPGDKTGQPCHFMKLPAEIRVDIYERVMQNAFNIITDDINSETYMWLVWYRDRIVGRTIETAFSFLHANQTMRLEALPFCQKLANDTAEYIKDEMYRLRPHWDSSSDSAGDSPSEVIDGMCSDKAYTKCLKLELYRYGLEEIQTGLRMVERHVYGKGEEMKGARGGKNKSGTSYFLLPTPAHNERNLQGAMGVSTQQDLSSFPAHVLVMDSQIAETKPAASGSLALKTPDIADAELTCRDETDTALVPPSAADLHLKKLSLAKGQVSHGLGAKEPGNEDKAQRACRFMDLPAELRLKIYEHHFQDVLESNEPRLAQYTRLAQYRRHKGLPPHYIRALEKSEMIKSALSFLHTNRKTRIEALPCYQALVGTLQESMEAEIDQMGSHWRWSAGDIMSASRYGHPFTGKFRDLQSQKLEMQYDDVCEIHYTLQLVESNMFKKDLNVRKTKGKTNEDGVSYAEHRLMKYLRPKNEETQGGSS